MNDTPPFLGRGWAFPPAFGSAGARMTQDEADIDASLRILFGTKPGERPLFPTYGLDLSELMFEPLKVLLRRRLADAVGSADTHPLGRASVTHGEPPLRTRRRRT